MACATTVPPATTGEASALWRRPEVVLPVLLAVSVLVVYGRAVSFPFTNWDDDHFIRDNAYLHHVTWESLRRIFVPGAMPRELLYIPVTYLGFVVEGLVTGLSAASVHATNVVLQALNTVLVFCLLRRLGGRLWGAFLGALVWAVHPLQVEAVIWAMGRKDLLAGTGAIACLLAYHRYAVSGRVSWLGWAVAAYTFGVFAKPSVVLLPAALPLLDIVVGRPSTPVEWGRKILFVVPGLLAMLLNRQIPADPAVVHGGLGAALAGLPSLASGWLARLFFLSRPLAVYAREGGGSAWAGVPVLLLALGALGAAAGHCRRGGRGGWGILLAALLAAPAAAIAIRGRDFVTADRYGYLPLLGLVIAVVTAATRLSDRPRRALGAVGIVWLLLAGGQTWRQVGMWENSRRLWTRVLDHYPACALAWSGLGMTYVEDGDPETAATIFAQGLAATDHDPGVLLNLGRALLDTGRPAAARACFEQLAAANPTSAKIRRNLGDAYRQLGEVAPALAAYERAVALDPNDVGALAALAALYRQLGRLEEAAAAYTRALARQPANADLHYNLALTYHEQERPSRELDHYLQALRLDPGLVAARYNLGNLYLERGEWRMAIHAYEAVLARDPAHTEALVNLGIARFHAGDAAGAVGILERAIARDSGRANAQFYLGRALAAAGRHADALVALRRALALSPGNAAIRHEIDALAPAP